MTLIGRSATHDTFIANSRAGKLLTITWPTSRFVHWTGATVREGTWQNFEHLTATSCGSSGTLLLGIDSDTRTGHLPTVGHANGRNTVTKGLGKVPMTCSDPHYFRWAPYHDVLNGG